MVNLMYKDTDNTWKSILDMFYPIGSIYQSTKSTSPASLIGGSWQAITEKFLLGAGKNYLCGQTGGEEDHTLTVDEMPKHRHSENIYLHAYGGSNAHHHRTVWDDSNNVGDLAYTTYVGGGNLTTICHPITSFIFGRELLNTSKGGVK